MVCDLYLSNIIIYFKITYKMHVIIKENNAMRKISEEKLIIRGDWLNGQAFPRS